MINEALQAAKNVDGVEIIKLNSLSPIEFAPIIESVKKTGKIIICEDVCNKGCVGEKIAAILINKRIKADVTLLNTGDDFVSHGAVSKLRAVCGIDADSIYERIMEA